jgi:hypothetical protein
MRSVSYQREVDDQFFAELRTVWKRNVEASNFEARGNELVEAISYKPEGGGFDSR